MRNNKGFSLVELIVVIAIMAILAAVAVVGVSVYIPKAQKAADEQMISDIEYALHLAMQTGELDDYPVGKLVLSTEGIKFYAGTEETSLEGTEVEKVLIASFGANYQDVLKLKYDSWAASSTLLNGMIAEEAGLVKDSSYFSGSRSDQLLKDVEMFTDMATNLAEAMGTQLNGASLAGIYGQDLLDATADKYGIKVTDEKYMKTDGSGNVDWDKWSKDYPQEFSNMLVLAASVDYQQEKADPTNHDYSTATKLIQNFSSYYAFAATCTSFSIVLDEYMAAMNSTTPTTTQHAKIPVTLQPVNSADAGKAWYDALNAELTNGGYVNSAGQTYAQYTQRGENNTMSSADQDALAFGAILSSLGNVSASDISGDLGNANLFTEGAVKDKYDQYLGAVDLMYGFNGDFHVEDGEIAIVYNQNLCTAVDSISQ